MLVTSTILCHAQSTTISGFITDASNGDPLAGVNITVKNRVIGTISNPEGEYELVVDILPPFTLQYSFIGFTTAQIEVTENNATINVKLEEGTLLGQEVVVSASRVAESILESPVSIEKIDILDIQQAPSQDFFGSLVNQKNVDMTTQSFTFRSISLRGFNAYGNTRMVQLIDGVDNQDPGLNFAVGNIAGLADLDVESIELLPGASSAL